MLGRQAASSQEVKATHQEPTAHYAITIHGDSAYIQEREAQKEGNRKGKGKSIEWADNTRADRNNAQFPRRMEVSQKGTAEGRIGQSSKSNYDNRSLRGKNGIVGGLIHIIKGKEITVGIEENDEATIGPSVGNGKKDRIMQNPRVERTMSRTY